MTQARSTIVKDNVEGTYHCISRCVRRAFLCGRDPATKRDYEHRKKWLYLRLVDLAEVFYVDVCGYAIMNNHFHVILRNRPDLALKSSWEDIARRWWRLFPKRRTLCRAPAEPTLRELEVLLAGEEREGELRKRLSSISWFMRCLKENIARRANAEDECTGRFWEGRFKCIALLDQAAILTCAAYVDLNPIRSGIAATPEASRFTSAEERIMGREGRKRLYYRRLQSKMGRQAGIPGDLKRAIRRDQWLCPLKSEPGRRGFLEIDLDDYLQLLDWTGRRITHGKCGAISTHLEPILKRLEINHHQWLIGSKSFGTMFYRVAGTVSSMTKAARAVGQKWFRGLAAGESVFLGSA